MDYSALVFQQYFEVNQMQNSCHHADKGLVDHQIRTRTRTQDQILLSFSGSPGAHADEITFISV